MKIYDVAIASDQYKGVPINQPIVLYEIPQGATFLKLQLISPHLHIIYSMEDEPPQSELEAAIEKAGKTKYTLYEVQEDGTSKPIRTFESSERLEPLKRVGIWKQQQDLKQPDERTDASRKLNQELLRQYQEKVAEIEKLLES